jgi:TonB-dependent receptor
MTMYPQNPRVRSTASCRLRRSLLSYTCSISFLTMAVPSALMSQQEEEQVIELEAVEVYSAAQTASVAKRRDGDTIGSYIDSDALSDMPDDDLGEALSRLAGVNVIGGRGGSESSVTIRGAEGQYNSIRINGAAQANARISSRSFDLNKIPAEMVSSIEVLKSITAEHPSDSIGGSVNVETGNGFSVGRKMTRFKLESRLNDLADDWGYGANFIHSNIYDVFGGEDNFAALFNINWIDEDFTVWNTQNRFLSGANRLQGSIDPTNSRYNPESAAIANAAILDVNPDATTPLWDRFDPDERRLENEEFTFNASFDLKVGDETQLYFRPWYQNTRENRDFTGFRIDRLERSFGGNFFFLDDNGTPLGQWADTDGDGVAGSEDDTFIRATDSNGDLIVTSNFEANDDGRIDLFANNRKRDGERFTLDFGGETFFDDNKLEYRILYSKDTVDSFTREWRFRENHNDARLGDPLRTRVTIGSTPVPLFEIFEVTEKKGHVPANGGQNIFSEAHNRVPTNVAPVFNYEDVSEDVVVASVDYDHAVNDRFNLKSGVRLRSSERNNITNQLFFAPSAGSRRVLPPGEIAQVVGPMTLFDGRFADSAIPFLNIVPAFDYFYDDVEANPGNWEFLRTDLRDTANTADLEETITAGYLQGTYRWNHFTLVAGARYEQTDLDVTWRPSNFFSSADNLPGLTSQQKTNVNSLVQNKVQDLGFTGAPGSFNFGEIVDDIRETSSYGNFLPSAVLSYRPGDTGHVFRLAYTETLTRPDFRELIPFDLAAANKQLQEFGLLNLTNRDEEFDIGNPDLSEQTSQNIDVAWEYYFGNSRRNTFSVTYFEKSLDDFLQQETFVRDVELLLDPTDPSAGTELVRSDAIFWTNASSRDIQGIEVSGYFHAEDLLPSFGLLHGFSLVANYTHITGNQIDPVFDQNELDNGNFIIIDEVATGNLTNQAEDIVNLQLIFEKGRLSTRLSYNYISRLQRTPSTAAISNTTFDRAQERLNLSVQYRISRADSDHILRLFLEADNLTDTPQDERYIGSRPGLFTTSYQETGRRFVFGIRASL